MSKEDNAQKLLKDLNFNIETTQTEADFMPAINQVKGGVLLDDFTGRFKSLKVLVSHLEKELHAQSFNVGDNLKPQHLFKLSNPHFSEMCAYKEDKQIKLWLKSASKKPKL